MLTSAEKAASESSEAERAMADPVRVMVIGRESYLLRLAVAVRSMTDNLGPDQSLVVRIVEDGSSYQKRLGSL